MKILLLTNGNGPNLPCKLPYQGASYVLPERACPHCAATGEDFKVSGGAPYPSADDRAWECGAVCLACRKGVGVLRVETGTLFGVTEDAAVLNGRWRVY